MNYELLIVIKCFGYCYLNSRRPLALLLRYLNMGVTHIGIEFERDTYNPGQLVSGRVLLRLDSPKDIRGNSELNSQLLTAFQTQMVYLKKEPITAIKFAANVLVNSVRNQNSITSID